MKRSIVILLCLSVCAGVLFFAKRDAVAPRTGDVLVKEDVVARSGNLTSRPEWTEGKTLAIKDGNVYMIGKFEEEMHSSTDDNLLIRIVEIRAREELVKVLERKMDAFFKASADANAGRIRQPPFRPVENYWEKVDAVYADGSKKKIFRAFTRVSIPEAAFKFFVSESAKRRSGKESVSEDILRQIEARWDDLKN